MALTDVWGGDARRHVPMVPSIVAPPANRLDVVEANQAAIFDALDAAATAQREAAAATVAGLAKLQESLDTIEASQGATATVIASVVPGLLRLGALVDAITELGLRGGLKASRRAATARGGRGRGRGRGGS